MKTAKEIVLQHYPQFAKSLNGQAVMLKTIKMMKEYEIEVVNNILSIINMEITSGVEDEKKLLLISLIKKIKLST